MGLTSPYNFTTLNGSDAAGHESINTCITSINNRLNTASSGLSTAAVGGSITSGYTLVFTSGTFAAAQLGSAGIATSAIIADKIATGAVTSDKILDGTIAIGDLAFDPATQTELNTAVSNASTALSNHEADTTSIHGITDTSTLALKSGNTYTGTHDYTGATISVPTVTAGDNDTSAASTAFVATAISNTVSGTNVINTNAIVNEAVTYAKLASDAKSFDVPTSGTGVYFTASGDFTSASLSTASAQNPVVISAASSAIDLSLPNTVGTEGATITVCQTGTGAVTIKPKVGATATINGSTSNVYVLGAQYSVVTLICLSNSGSNGTWVITGDYI